MSRKVVITENMFKAMLESIVNEGGGFSRFTDHADGRTSIRDMRKGIASQILKDAKPQIEKVMHYGILKPRQKFMLADKESCYIIIGSPEFSPGPGGSKRLHIAVVTLFRFDGRQSFESMSAMCTNRNMPLITINDPSDKWDEMEEKGKISDQYASEMEKTWFHPEREIQGQRDKLEKHMQAWNQIANGERVGKKKQQSIDNAWGRHDAAAEKKNIAYNQAIRDAFPAMPFTGMYRISQMADEGPGLIDKMR